MIIICRNSNNDKQYISKSVISEGKVVIRNVVWLNNFNAMSIEVRMWKNMQKTDDLMENLLINCVYSIERSFELIFLWEMYQSLVDSYIYHCTLM